MNDRIVTVFGGTGFLGRHVVRRLRARLARVAEVLPHPPVTRNQVELMEVDTVTGASMPGLRELGITPRPAADTVRELVRDLASATR